MSDKAENVNWFKCRIGIGVLCGLAPVECDNHPCGQLFRTWPELVRHQASSHFPKSGIAGECTAPAPQPDWKKEALALVVLLRAKCSDEEWANMESRFATPQVTPCDHFWRTIAVNPRWSWFTECEKCKIGAPLELQAENYVENTEARRG